MNLIIGIQPWWVNIAMAAPVGVCLWWWIRGAPAFSKRFLLLLALIGFGFAVFELGAAIYIRAVVGMLLGYGGTWSGIITLGKAVPAEAAILGALPKNLFLVEFIRQFAVVAALVVLAILGGRSWLGRIGVFLWTASVTCLGSCLLAVLALGSPSSLAAPVVVFLVPVPWIAPAWVPLAVSALVVITLLFRSHRTAERE